MGRRAVLVLVILVAAVGGGACATPLARIKPVTHYTESLPSDWGRVRELLPESDVKLALRPLDTKDKGRLIDARVISADEIGITFRAFQYAGSEPSVLSQPQTALRESVTNVVLKGGSRGAAHAKRGIVAGAGFGALLAAVTGLLQAVPAMSGSFAFYGAIFGSQKHLETLLYVAPPGPGTAGLKSLPPIEPRPTTSATWPGVTALRSGARVRVEIAGAPSVAGKFVSATGDEITVAEAGSGRDATFQRLSIRRVLAIRSRALRQARGGFLIGAGVGAVLSAAFFDAFCDGCRGGARVRTYGAVFGAISYGASGASIGATNGLDELIEVPVYVAIVR